MGIWDIVYAYSGVYRHDPRVFGRVQTRHVVYSGVYRHDMSCLYRVSNNHPCRHRMIRCLIH